LIIPKVPTNPASFITGFMPYAMEKRADFEGKSLLAVH